MTSPAVTKPARWKWVVLLIAVTSVALLTVAIIIWAVLQALADTDQSRMSDALRAVDRNDLAVFRKCFDRLPVDADVTGFAQTVRTRYGSFRRLAQSGNWTEPTANHVMTGRFQLEFDRAKVPADVTVRFMVDEASATGNLDFLGQSRIVRIRIHDSANGDLNFP